MDIVITEFASRKKPNGVVKHTTWEELVERLKTPVYTDESAEEYRQMTNEQKTDAKDCGGYVAGEFKNGKRDKTLILSRYVLTIDADEASDHDVEDFQFLYDDVLFFAHTTHTSTAENPRLRWLFPLKRPVTAEEYRALVGVVKDWVGAHTVDERTDQPERLMFWPSVSWDSEYTYWVGGFIPIDPDEILDGIDPINYEPQEYSSKTSSDTPPLDDVIRVGHRNDALFKFAANQRQAGLDKDILLETLRLFNDKYCEEPLPDSDLKTIAWSACKYKKGEKITPDMLTPDDDFDDLGKSKKKEIGEPLENGNQLLARYIKPAVYLVEDMVTTGLGMVVAPPKFGKSWFALDVAISIATGTPFFGKKTVRSGVLYYALEDNDRRVQRRLGQVSGNERMDLSWFYHKEEAPTMNEGLFDEIDTYLKMYPEIKFVVIDTLQKVRPPAKRSEGAYSNDYNDAGKIQKYALSRDISILLVHHTRKIIDPNDLIGNISGTNGLSGAIDYAFGMSKKKWDDDQAKLEITGRDINKQTYMMTFNEVSYRWENLGSEKEVRESEEDRQYMNDPIVKTVKAYLGKLGKETEDDPITWNVNAQDLYDFCLQRCGTAGEGIDNTKKLGHRVNKLIPLLAQKDNIELKKEHDRSGSYYSFQLDRLEMNQTFS